MPKKECSIVFGHAPRKALGVKKASKKAPNVKKDAGSAKTKKDAGNAKAPKKAAPAALDVSVAHEHVSASTTPTASSPHSPTYPSGSPSYPRSPTYERESWWDSFHTLSRRVNDASAAIKDLKEKVKLLEEERENGAAGSVFGKRD